MLQWRRKPPIGANRSSRFATTIHLFRNAINLKTGLHMRKMRLAMLEVGALVALGGCAMPLFSPTVSVTPGLSKAIEAFRVDQYECTRYADQQVGAEVAAINNYEAASVALGAGFGAGLARVTDHDRFAPATTTAADGAVADGSLQRAYDRAYAQCMYAKGNQVSGFPQLTAVQP
jgi:hypothetical protein